ncbi:MAG: hypothetical protein QHH17_00575 [Candidatus Bathyarchaeota archaeon]|jgi:hypothetical protein|nr:hypothetical protein [Candidatus Bathyarchaeota archaeon]
MYSTVDPEILKLCRWGVFAFVAHALYNTFSLAVFTALELRFRAESLICPLELPYAFWMYFSLFLFVVPPIILAPIAYYKLYKPLKDDAFTSKTKKWNFVLSILGFPYAFIVGGLFLASAYKKWGKE